MKRIVADPMRDQHSLVYRFTMLGTSNLSGNGSGRIRTYEARRRMVYSHDHLATLKTLPKTAKVGALPLSYFAS